MKKFGLVLFAVLFCFTLNEFDLAGVSDKLTDDMNKATEAVEAKKAETTAKKAEYKTKAEAKKAELKEKAAAIKAEAETKKAERKKAFEDAKGNLKNACGK